MHALRSSYFPLLRWLHDDKKWAYHPSTAWLFAEPHRWGIDFPYKGDEVMWTWPWRRNGQPKYISLAFSGTGEFGDARFNTLQEIDAAWGAFENSFDHHGKI